MQAVMLEEVLNDLEHCTEILGMSQQAINVRKQCCSDNIVDRNSLIVFVCYLTPFCFLFSVISH